MGLEAAVNEVYQHLVDVAATPAIRLDARLLEHIDKQVSEALNVDQRTALLNQLSELLPSLQQDPQAATELIERLVAPEKVSFQDVLSIQPSPNLALGLASLAPHVNLVTLSLLDKARGGLGDINYVAANEDIVAQLVMLWLGTEETAVAHKACQVLTGLLLASEDARRDHIDPLLEPNLMWRRVFRDKDIYGTIFRICSLSTAGQDGQPSRRHKTVAQGRLLDLLLVVRADPVRTTQIVEIERQYGVKDGGLLEFAIAHMMDVKDDDLMLSTLINFCTNIIKTDTADTSKNPSLALDFLKRYGLHESCMSYYLQPAPIHPSWVVGDSARYIGTYCSSHQQSFINNPKLPDEIVELLLNHFGSISRGSWLSGRFPENDLILLSLLPQRMLACRGEEPILALVHPATSHVQIINTLSTIFRCYPSHSKEDQAAARALYFLYLEKHPKLWDVVITAAETVALLDPALAAHNFIGSIIDASWQPLPTMTSNTRFPLPTEDWLRRVCNYGDPLPATGVEAIFSTRTAQTVLPYLMKPAQTFGNAVGGGRGDVESAAWKIAVAKHDLLVRFGRKITSMGGSPEVQSMISTINKRIAQGPMGGSTQVGGQVGTMEL